MVNGTEPRKRRTASGWPWIPLDGPGSDAGLSLSQETEDRPGLPQRVDVEVKRIVRERGHWPTAEVVIDVWSPDDEKQETKPKPLKVYRGRLSLLSSSGKRDCVRACKDAFPPLGLYRPGT